MIVRLEWWIVYWVVGNRAEALKKLGKIWIRIKVKFRNHLVCGSAAEKRTKLLKLVINQPYK